MGAPALYNLGFVLLTAGLSEEGLRLLQEAKDLAATAARPDIGAAASTLQAYHATDRGDADTAIRLCVEALEVFSALGNTLRVLYAIEGVAGASGAKGDWRVAARLFGATEAIREREGITRARGLQQSHDDRVRKAREGCPREAFDAEWKEGRSLSLEQAADLARSVGS